MAEKILSFSQKGQDFTNKSIARARIENQSIQDVAVVANAVPNTKNNNTNYNEHTEGNS